MPTVPRRFSPSDLFRDALSLPDGFRFVRPDDVKFDFRTGEASMDGFTLKDYVAWSNASDGIVIVRTDETGAPDAVAFLVIEAPVVILEMVGRRRDSRTGFLALLLRVVERAARLQGFREMRLEAINDGVAARYERYGFQRVGRAQTNKDWGELIPMRKMLV